MRQGEAGQRASTEGFQVFCGRLGTEIPCESDPIPAPGEGPPPRAASRGPPGSTLTDNRSALLPLSGLSPTLPSPRAPSAWPLDRGRAAPPPSSIPWAPCCDFMPGISKSTIQRARPRNAGPTVPIRLKASALAVAVHWTLRRCHLRLSRRCVGRWRWFAFCFQLPRVTLAVCPLLGWPSDNTRSSPELSVRTCSVCRVSG